MNANDILFGNKMKSKEEYENEVNKYIKDIRREKRQALDEKLDLYTPKNLHKHKKNFKHMLVFLYYYIVGNIVIILMQLDLPTSYDQISIKQYISELAFTPDLLEFTTDFDASTFTE